MKVEAGRSIVYLAAASLDAGPGNDLDVSRLAERRGDGLRHGVDVVEVVALERGDHGIRVRKPADADGVEVQQRLSQHYAIAGPSWHDIEANIDRWVGQMQQPDGRPSSAVMKRSIRP